MTLTNGKHLRSRQSEPDGEQIVWAEPTARRVRVFFGGAAVADSNGVLVLFNGPRVPVYFFPVVDVRREFLIDGDRREMDPRLGNRIYSSLVVGTRKASDAVISYPEPISDGPDLTDYVTFVWDAMDAWFEEDEEILRHPRDPYKRVDVLHCFAPCPSPC